MLFQVTSPYGHLTPPEIGDLTLICVTQVSSPTEVSTGQTLCLTKVVGQFSSCLDASVVTTPDQLKLNMSPTIDRYAALDPCRESATA